MARKWQLMDISVSKAKNTLNQKACQVLAKESTSKSFKPRVENLGTKMTTCCVKDRGTTSSLQILPPAAFYFKEEVVLAPHPPSCHPWRVFGNQERERKRREKRENWKENEKLRVCTERKKVRVTKL